MLASCSYPGWLARRTPRLATFIPLVAAPREGRVSPGRDLGSKKAVKDAPWWKSLGGKSRAGNILNGFRLLPHRQLDLNGKHILMQAAKTRQKSGKSGKHGKPFANPTNGRLLAIYICS